MAYTPPTSCKQCQAPINNGGFFGSGICTKCANIKMQNIAAGISAANKKAAAILGAKPYPQGFQSRTSRIGKWGSIYGEVSKNPYSQQYEENQKEDSNRILKMWLERLKQFIDLPTEYPDEFDERSDLQIYLVAIHELEDQDVTTLMSHINAECFETKWYLTYPQPTQSHRKLTPFDAFVIREYCHRTLKAIKEEEERKAAEEAMRSRIYEEDWYKEFPDVMKYRLETAVEHRIAQRIAENIGDDNAARQNFELFKTAYNYEKAIQDTSFFAEDINRYEQTQNISAELDRRFGKGNWSIDSQTHDALVITVDIESEDQTIRKKIEAQLVNQFDQKQQQELNKLLYMFKTKQISKQEYERRCKIIRRGK